MNSGASAGGVLRVQAPLWARCGLSAFVAALAFGPNSCARPLLGQRPSSTRSGAALPTAFHMNSTLGMLWRARAWAWFIRKGWAVTHATMANRKARVMSSDEIRRTSLTEAKRLGYGTNPTLPLLDDNLSLRSQGEIVSRA